MGSPQVSREGHFQVVATVWICVCLGHFESFAGTINDGFGTRVLTVRSHQFCEFDRFHQMCQMFLTADAGMGAPALFASVISVQIAIGFTDCVGQVQAGVGTPGAVVGNLYAEIIEKRFAFWAGLLLPISSADVEDRLGCIERDDRAVATNLDEVSFELRKQGLKFVLNEHRSIAAARLVSVANPAALAS